MPIPLGLTTPIPVMTTRGSMRGSVRCDSVRVSCCTRLAEAQAVPEWDNQAGCPSASIFRFPSAARNARYCNFASDVFSRAVFERYVERVCADIHSTPKTARQMGGRFERDVDSIYLGGGTPTVLDSQQLERLFVTVEAKFSSVARDAEITVECAPGTLSAPVLDTLLRCGVNRVSLGVQSFVDQEAAVGGAAAQEGNRARRHCPPAPGGIANINVDLIAGLPHQTAESWKASVRGGDRDRRAARQRLHARGRRGFAPGPRIDGRWHPLPRPFCSR